jgi:hypothetical protein
MKKRILLMPLLGALMLAMAPAAQAAVVGDIELLNATINQNGVVKVVGEVTCPSGYDITNTRAQIEQQVPGDDLTSRRLHFSSQVSCTGSPDRFSVKFRRSTTDEPFQADELTQIDLRFTATNDGNTVTGEDVTTVTL